MIIKVALGYLLGRFIWNFMENMAYAYLEYKQSKR